MKCLKCGMEITEDVMFCPKCMTRITDTAKAPVTNRNADDLEKTVGVNRLSDIEVNSALYDRKIKETAKKCTSETENNYAKATDTPHSYFEKNPEILHRDYNDVSSSKSNPDEIYNPVNSKPAGDSVSSGVPSMEYGMPDVAATPNYGMPDVAATPNYGMPNVAATPNYGMPNVAATPNYGMPNVAATPNYGMPNVAATPNYSVPNAAVTPNYGMTANVATPAYSTTPGYTPAVAPPPPPSYVETSSEYYPEKSPEDYIPEKKEKKNNRGNTILFAVVGALSAILIVVLVLVFCTDIFKKTEEPKKDVKTENTFNCEICNEEMENEQPHCDKCKNEYKCELCDQVKSDVKDGYCDKCKKNFTCRECGKIEASVDERGVCNSCVLRCITDGCSNVIEGGYYCEECLSNIEGGEPLCSYCEEIVDPEDIFIITTNGEGFCVDCDEGHYCEDCKALLSKDDDDDICYWCADYFCEECDDVLEEDEIEEFEGGEYCEECADVKRAEKEAEEAEKKAEEEAKNQEEENSPKENEDDESKSDEE